ncbi:MAG: hypothetical protein K6G40_07930 [Eubacterium sp.]|nr:hypothetical protein [Eubacterium sp.]
MDNNNYEIERKYLIEYPDTEMLSKLEGTEIAEITQDYLTKGKNNENRRVRMWNAGGCIHYIYTEKKKITNIRRIENECEITKEEYDILIKEKDPACMTVKKTRYRVPYSGLLYEIDVFDGVLDSALMEAEIESEDTEIPVPPFANIIREVTNESGFTNYSIAKNGYQRF